MAAKITIVSAGHLSTRPRVVKAADALAEADFDVRVVSARYVGWATEADEDLRRKRSWRWSVVDYGRTSSPWTWMRTGLRYRAANMLARILGPPRCPRSVAARARSRAYPELLRMALAEPADLFYGETVALAATASAARRKGVPYALDLVDFHSAEQDDGPAGCLGNRLAERIERAVLPGAAFLTAGSEAIAAAYAEKYGVRPVVVNNVFPLPAALPDLAPSPGGGLRLYWFSQTIGPGRGLEDAVRAMGIAGVPGELHLRGRAIPSYLEGLRALGARSAPQLKIVQHDPASPDDMVDLARGYDVGLALEQPHIFNRSICLTNKAFTYMLAGLAVAFTDTPGQRHLALDLGEGAVLYRPGDVEALAAGLKRWADDKPLLGRAKAAAWEAAKRRWHWEHPEERGALLGAVEKALS